MHTHQKDIEAEEDQFDEEEAEDLDEPLSTKFRSEGQLMSYEEDPVIEGYLALKVRTKNKRILHSIIKFRATSTGRTAGLSLRMMHSCSLR